MSTASKTNPPRQSGFARKCRLVLLAGVIPVGIVVASGFGAKYMIDSAPKAERRASERQARLVEVQSVTAGAQVVEIDAMGTVMAARQVELRPQVAGRIEWMSEGLVPGGRFAQGDPLMRIETRDYELAVAQRESELKVAEAQVIEANRRLTLANRDLRIEMGNQSVARRDFEMLEGQLDEDDAELILRKPQLEAAQADVEAAQAAVQSAEAALLASAARIEQAQLDLQRTTISAPFNLVVVEKLVDVGDTVGTGTQLVNMIGSDEFWIELTVPQSDVQWVRMPDAQGQGGSTVRIYNGSRADQPQHVGQVIRRLPGVDAMGRMVRLLVSVKDPMALDSDRQPLLIGNYVRGTIEGVAFDHAVAVPRSLVRSGDVVWVMTDDGTLDIRPLNVTFRGRDHVLLQSGLAAGERLVTTELSAPVPGMALRVNEATDATVDVAIKDQKESGRE